MTFPYTVDKFFICKGCGKKIKKNLKIKELSLLTSNNKMIFQILRRNSQNINGFIPKYYK